MTDDKLKDIEDRLKWSSEVQGDWYGVRPLTPEDVSALIAEVRRLQPDAARYQHLRSLDLFANDGVDMRGEKLDAKIDQILSEVSTSKDQP
jgi:hypothetical protein